jgi:3-oxoadipate enol-lactonase
VSSFITSDGCSIEYQLRSRTVPKLKRIVLIHSLALDASIWGRVVARLIDHADILTYDCRGHGRSAVAAVYDRREAGAHRATLQFTTDLFARDLAELLDHVEWPGAVVAGCSMGGCVAQAFAGLYPERIRGLGLIDTTAWYGEDAPTVWRERAGAARAKGLAGLIDFQVTRWFSDQYRNAHPDIVAAATKVFLANDLDCYAASCILLGDADLRSYLPSLRVPVEIVVGEDDYATPVTAAQSLHELIRGSRLTILPGARHLTPIECPGEVASCLMRLIE